MTYALIVILWAGSPHEDRQVVRDGLTLEECRHIAALFSLDGFTPARYECVAR